ncbi:diguanylate cyclase/phosphodiesterase [Enhygromyxa salina]|uniref:Diguanylate cyclase/phosphodiesterase n=1 Tax=Enhygromyxa salina TaxID=215803 RepID=A0A0C1Z3W1_9BACT|nr:NACHT domain-containing protein [Enhygromyxa salina]KIG12374.1 diguanylate cyclase/phosphodiesterase [Enhygromyxa salina]
MPHLPRLDLFLLGTDGPDSKLDVAQEFDEISNAVEQRTPDDHVCFELKRRRRTTLDELPEQLCKYAPHMLHISGHANDAGELAFAGELVSPAQMSSVITRAIPGLRCVVLNICNGEPLAECLSEHVDVVISMDGVVTDDAARSFARTLYVALREGDSVRGSFELARGRLDLGAGESAEAPRLHSLAVDPSEVYLVDFAVDERRLERRREWLADIIADFEQMRPAERLLCRTGEQRPLRELIVPIELVAIDANDQPGIEVLSIEQVWDRSKGSLLLTGEVGSGKSTTLMILAHELAQRTSPEGAEPVPMMMPATRLANLRKDRAARLEFGDLVKCGPGEIHQVFLLIDAFDELTPNLWSWGKRCLRELSDSNFVARLVVTSRPQSALPRAVFSRYQLRPWTEAHIAEFARRWGFEAHARLGELETGNPLTLTLACAYAQRASAGLLALLRVVLRDLREDWRQRREQSTQRSHDEDDIEDCCLWLMLGPREKDPSVFPRAHFNPILDFLEQEGLVCTGDEPLVLPGARWVVEYLAARACIRHGYDLELPGGRLELGELTKVALALEIELEPERARARLGRIFDLTRGRDAFRFRMATRAARACSLFGPDLDDELTVLAVECMWRHVIDDCSRWKSAKAAEVLESLCRANSRAAERVRQRMTTVIDCSDEDATAELAARDGLLHISARVRVATVEAWEPSSPEIGAFLHQQMLDQGQMNHANVAIAAGRVFRSIPRTPELQPAIEHLATHLWSGDQSLSASAAVALRPGEVALEVLRVGMMHLFELGQCSEDICADFLAAPGGPEAAKTIRSSMSVNGDPPPTLADGPRMFDHRTPVSRYSIFVQRSCWRWLVPVLGTTHEALADIARRKACGYNNTAAFTAVVRIAQRHPEVLVDVFARAMPWSLVVEPAANQVLRMLVSEDERVLDALLAYLRRSMDAKIGGHFSIIEMLEPVLERSDARALFTELLPYAWFRPPFNMVIIPYRLLPELLTHPEVAARACTYTTGLIDQVESGRLVPTSAAEPLINAGWFHWQTTEVVLTQLEAWIERGGNHARLAALLLRDMPGPMLDALRPALDTYLAREITRDNYEDALARELVFHSLPRAAITGDALARFEAHALSHAGLSTTGSLAAIVALCRVSGPARASELSTMAAVLRLDACGFPDNNMHEHMRLLAPLAPVAWLCVACQHSIGLQTATAIFEALLASADPKLRSEFAHWIWSRLQHDYTPYRTLAAMDLVGQRPSDLAQHWLYDHADVWSFDERPSTPNVTEDEPSVAANTPTGGAASLLVWEHRTAGRWFDRREQLELLKLTFDDDDRPILLMGGPGTGKSSLLRWLSDLLPRAAWTVVAIKADLIPDAISDELELCDWLGFGRTRLHRVLKQLACERRVCLIFDQLDALATTVDMKTRRLVMLLQLVRQACKIEGVQVIASTRHFELRYDPRLRKLRDEGLARELELHPLPSETTARAWQLIKGESVAQEFVRARTPWALRLMLELDDRESDESTLLAAFWRQRVNTAPSERQAELRALTQQLETRESLWSEPSPNCALDFWCERGVLTAIDGRYGFVHQSLFDYARAERVIHDQSLVALVLARQDGLAIRPLLRATLRVLGGIGRAQYSRTVRALWRTPDLRAHVRVLLVEHISEQLHPSPDEIEWMREAIGYRGLGERGVRPVARTAVAGSPMWFDELRDTIRQLMSTDLGGEFVGVLASFWSSAPEIIEGWIEQAWMGDDTRVAWASEVLCRRRSWTERGAELALALVEAGMGEDHVRRVAYTLGQHAPEHEARFVARYAARVWRDGARDRVAEKSRLSSPWDLASGLDWERAAEHNPTQYLETITPALIPVTINVSYERRPGHFLSDRYSRYLRPVRMQLRMSDGPLVGFGVALQALARTARESFWAWVDRLATTNHDVIQSMILEATAHVVEQDSARIVALLLADRRRWLLTRAIPRVLPSLAPKIDENQAAQLWEEIRAINIEDPAYLHGKLKFEATERRELLHRNIAYRAYLAKHLTEAPLLPEARVAVAQASRTDETAEYRPPRFYPVHSRSPYDHQQLARMPDANVLAALGRYDDGASETIEQGTQLTNERMGAELREFGKRDGARVLALLPQLPDRGQFYSASALLRGASENHEVEPDDLVDTLNATWARGFHADLWFRQTCVDVLGDVASRLSNDARAIAVRIVDEALALDWGPRTSPDDDEPAETEADDRPLFPPTSRAYGTPNIYSALRAAVWLRLVAEGDDAWLACLEFLDAQLDRLPAACWRLLLDLELWPGSLLVPRWLDWLARLFERYPSVLGSPVGAYQLLYLRRHIDESRMRRWLEALRSNPWPSGARAADELTTMLACGNQHRRWARPLAESWLTTSLADHELGVLHGLATARNDLESPAAVDWALVPFVKVASPPGLDSLFQNLHRDGLRMTTDMLDALLVLEARGHAILPKARAQLMKGLSELIDARPGDVGRAARHIAASEPVGAGLFRDDYLVSIAIGLHGKPDQRALGMELFERWQTFDPQAAHALLEQSDTAYWAGNTLSGVASRAPRQPPLVLYATASPSQRPLDIGLEHKEIVTAIRDRAVLEPLPAVNKRDLITGLRSHRPTILVFSGHHDPQQGLELRGPHPNDRLYLPLDEFVRIVEMTCGHLPILALNTCSVDAAEQLAHVAGAVVHCEQIVEDADARAFIAAFLAGLFDGAGVGEAFRASKLVADAPYAIAYGNSIGIRSSTVFELRSEPVQS